MEILGVICMGNTRRYILPTAVFCSETTLKLLVWQDIFNFSYWNSIKRHLTQRVILVPPPLHSTIIAHTSPSRRIIRTPGVGRQQPVPVRGGENKEQRRYFLRGSFLGAGECGTRAGDTAGEHQHKPSPARSLAAWPTAAAVHSSRGGCTTFLWNITAFNGMWLVTLLLLYSLQEGTCLQVFLICMLSLLKCFFYLINVGLVDCIKNGAADVRNQTPNHLLRNFFLMFSNAIPQICSF